jgi:hypothetical protein
MPNDPRKRSIYNKYGGEVLRSLLERRWCMAFDAIGLRWGYEPLRLPTGNRSYMPDFYFRDLVCFGEVKPIYPSPGELFLAAMLCEWERVPVYFLIGEPTAGFNCRYVYDPTRRHGVRWEESVTPILQLAI